MKQKTMHVDSSPSDGSDGEAVSPSSTKLFIAKMLQMGIFCARSSIRRASREENTHLNHFI